MVDPGNDFDDASEDESLPPLLPPADRLWRHPSELAIAGRATSPEAAAARDRWLSSTPTRAGAWSAGLVGAVLATGVVLIGTHVTDWISPRAPASEHTQLTTVITSPSSMFVNRVAMAMPTAAAASVSGGMALVEASGGSAERSGDGIVLRADGMILVPQSVIQGATDVQVTTSDHQQFDATVVGVDTGTGLALLHAQVSGLTPEPLGSATIPSAGDWTAFEWASSIQTVFSVASVDSATTGARLQGGPGLLLSIGARTVGLPSNPVGAVMVDADWRVAGIVAARHGSMFVEVPPAVLERVGAELMAYHRVIHGWLGITGTAVDRLVGHPGESPMTTSTSRPGQTRPSLKRGDQLVVGVRVISVQAASAAARAGIRPGDVIEEVNGLPVRDMADLQTLLYFAEPRQSVALTVERGSASWGCSARLQAAA